MDTKNINIFQALENIKGSEINRKYFLDNLDNFNLTKQDEYGENGLMYILYSNKFKRLGFNRDDILSIMEKFDLNQKNNIGRNALMYIIFYNKHQNLGFNKKDLLNILDKFDLSQKDINKIGIYDLIVNNQYNHIGFFDENELSFLVSKLDIETTDKENSNILIKELKNGMMFNNKELVAKILNTNNKKIIHSVYSYINQIKMSGLELSLFMEKYFKV